MLRFGTLCPFQNVKRRARFTCFREKSRLAKRIRRGRIFTDDFSHSGGRFRETAQKGVSKPVYLMVLEDVPPDDTPMCGIHLFPCRIRTEIEPFGTQVSISGTAHTHTRTHADTQTEMNRPPAGPRCSHAGTGRGGLQKVSRSLGFPLHSNLYRHMDIDMGWDGME